MKQNVSFRDAMDRLTVPGTLVTALEDGIVVCQACAHRCRIRPGARGYCQVRFNQAGQLMVPSGYILTIAPDPVEKKPLYHFMPGSTALTFGMPGCNMRCEFCQNWDISQVLVDDCSSLSAHHLQSVQAPRLIDLALASGAELIVSSYNEPLITSEWAKRIFEHAHDAGLKTAFISNGFATHEVIDFLRPSLDALKVDLKSFDPQVYRQLGGGLTEVLDTIGYAHSLGLWVEVVTLVIPGFNDSPRELFQMAEFIRSVSVDIPWHVTAFHPDYRMLDRDRTQADSLMQAVEIGQEAGLRYVYAGNLPGQVRHYEDTICHHCQALLIQRRGMRVLENRLAPGGVCPACGTPAAGVWR